MITKAICVAALLTGATALSAAWARPVAPEEMTPVHHGHHAHHRHVARNRAADPASMTDAPQEQVAPEQQVAPEPEIFYHASGADGAH